MTNVALALRSQPVVGQQDVEIVERKGIGHPDTICDALMESASVALSAAYLQACGQPRRKSIQRSEPSDRAEDSVEGIRATYAWLCSQIRRPLDDPWTTSVELNLTSAVHLADVEPSVRAIVDDELHRVDRLVERLCRSELAVY